MFNFFKKKSNYQASLHFAMQPMWSRRSYHSFANDGYTKNVIAFRAINMIATSISAIPFLLYRITKAGRIQENHHPLLNLLEFPNRNTPKSEFMEAIASIN